MARKKEKEKFMTDSVREMSEYLDDLELKTLQKHENDLFWKKLEKLRRSGAKKQKTIAKSRVRRTA